MAEQFNLDQFLMEKGFSYSNYGDHQLYEIEVNEENYAVNLQGQKMTTNASDGVLKVDIKAPENAKEAQTWLNTFLGIEQKNTSKKK